LKKDNNLKTKKYNIGIDGLSYFIIKPLIKELLHIPFVLLRSVRAKSLEPFFISLRELRFTLEPNSRCTHCGQKVKQKWVPILEYVTLPSLNEDLRLCIGLPPAKLFESIYVGCKYCDSSIPSNPVYGNIIARDYDRELDSWGMWHIDEVLDYATVEKHQKRLNQKRLNESSR